jgi:Raf kinase inhibitor-like YbhB/YbcL family protein
MRKASLRPAAVAAAMLALSFGAAVPVHAQQGDGTNVPISTVIFKPAKVEATPERIAALKVPEGFSIAPFATGLKNARILAVAPNGTVYLSRRDQGDVLMLRDTDGDGRADGAPVIVANRAGAHGLAIRDNKLYLVTVKELFVADIKADGTLGELKMLLGDLPDSGQHPNRTMAFGPDGMLYLSVGSTCNTCNESNPESATMLRVSPDGKQRSIFASGLRNTIGFGWQPATGEFWGMDHGIDYLGDEIQQEELNRLELGKQYGWPHVSGPGDIYPQSTPVGEITKEQWKAQSVPMVMGYSAHAAPMQLVFYSRAGIAPTAARAGAMPASAAFPAAYDGDAFVTMRGSWNRNPASGYEIVRVRFSEGKPVAFEPFATGFLTDGGKTHIARPVGLARAADGALLMADDANGVIYRIAYNGSAAGAALSAVNSAAGSTVTPASPPAGPMLQQAARGTNVPLANKRPETATGARAAQAALSVRSAAFANNGRLDMRFSEYADGVSPPLSWSAVPNAKSYVVIMEDPDARPALPFVHWLAWNIPASVTSLQEGLQKQPRLTAPEGVLQGRNTRGSMGYYGPRPPVGDPDHHYHFQVYALDKMLETPFGADRDTLLKAMEGHVLAKGDVIGLYRQAVKPPK